MESDGFGDPTDQVAPQMFQVVVTFNTEVPEEQMEAAWCDAPVVAQ